MTSLPTLSPFSLYSRFLRQGTIAEPKGVPEPRFALQATVYWVRALNLLAKAHPIDWPTMLSFYSAVRKATLTDQAKNTVFEQLLMSLHHLSSLRAMSGAVKRVDIGRSAIVTWYYGIYHAASAMIAAQHGTHQDSHAETSNVWDRELTGRQLVAPPFDMRLTSLVEATTKVEIANLLAGASARPVHEEPTSIADAHAACVSYLSGSADYYRWLICEDIRGSREFKTLGVKDFRTNAAKALRDGRFAGRTLGFVHQAFRYRGKANYREALFISYGLQVETLLNGFNENLADVLHAFLTMAGAFCSKRIGKAEWGQFTADLDQNLPLTITPAKIWA